MPRILCGHCKGRHESVTAVRQCSLGLSSDGPDVSQPGVLGRQEGPTKPSHRGTNNEKGDGKTRRPRRELPGYRQHSILRKAPIKRMPSYRERKHPSEYGSVTTRRPPRPEHGYGAAGIAKPAAWLTDPMATVGVPNHGMRLYRIVRLMDALVDKLRSASGHELELPRFS